MDIVIRLAPLMLSWGIPSGNPQVCKGGDSCRCWALEGVSSIAAVNLSIQMYLERESWCRMHSPQCKSPKAAHWSRERIFYYKLLDVSPSFLCGLLQIGPDLGTLSPALCRPLGGMAFLYWLAKDTSSCTYHVNWLLK